MMTQILFSLKIYNKQKYRLFLTCFIFVITLAIFNFVISLSSSVIVADRWLKDADEASIITLSVNRGPSFNTTNQPVKNSFDQSDLYFLKGQGVVKEILPDLEDRRLTSQLKQAFKIQYPQLDTTKLKVFYVSQDYFNFFGIPISYNNTENIDYQYSVAINTRLNNIVKGTGKAEIQIYGDTYSLFGIVEDDNRGLHLQTGFLREEFYTVYLIANKNNFPNSFSQVFIKPSCDVGEALRDISSSIDEAYTSVNGLLIQSFITGVNQLLAQVKEGSVVTMVYCFLLFICTEISLFGTFYLTSKKRARDFCIRMVYGAVESNIFWEIVAEFMFVSILGTSIGVMISKFLIDVVNNVMVPPVLIKSSFGLSSIVLMCINGLSLLLALYPAYIASNQKPAQVLRDI